MVNFAPTLMLISLVLVTLSCDKGFTAEDIDGTKALKLYAIRAKQTGVFSIDPFEDIYAHISSAQFVGFNDDSVRLIQCTMSATEVFSFNLFKTATAQARSVGIVVIDENISVYNGKNHPVEETEFFWHEIPIGSRVETLRISVRAPQPLEGSVTQCQLYWIPTSRRMLIRIYN